MFFEPLEARHLMAVIHGDGPFAGFEGNYQPPQTYQTAPLNYLSGPAQGDPLSVGLGYLRANAGGFGLAPNDFNNFTVTDRYTSEDTGITHIYLQQTFNGLPVANALASINVTSTGRVLTAAANFIHNLPHPAQNTSPVADLTSMDALLNFSGATGFGPTDTVDVVSVPQGASQKTVFRAPGVSLDDVPVELHYVPVPGGVELAWKMTVRTPDGLHWYDASVSASAASEHYQQVVRVVDWVSHASYNVFATPAKDPLDGPRLVVVDPHSTKHSPFGWHDTNGVPGPDVFTTEGNNALVRDDIDGDDLGGLVALGGPTLNFDFPINLAAPPIINLAPALTNTFYWMNLAHDITAHHGFTEAAGNFQFTNYSGNGLGNDPVQVDIQDPIAFGNAFIFTPPDGISPQVTVGEFPLPPLPNRDAAFNGDVLVHEFGHGVSNRLTGGPNNASALFTLQSGGMGEGWSDWLALMLTMDKFDRKETPQTIGNWIIGGFGTTGIRRFAYSYDMGINPLTLDDFNGGFPNNEVHNAGEIWASALWDMSWLLIEKYGFDEDLFRGNGGNNIAIRLVLDGMKLQPASPTFMQARDAILAADLARNGGANYELIWKAFARRGFGEESDAGANADSDIVVENFERPLSATHVSGKVWNDKDGDGKKDGNEGPLAGWTVYIDADNDGNLDGNEHQFTTGSDGKYTLAFIGVGQVNVRQVVQNDFNRIAPDGGRFQVQAGPGLDYESLDFFNQEKPGEIHGLKWNDLDGDGVKDGNEPGMAGIMIYVDVNNDGKIGVLEPAGITDQDGKYKIKDIRPGTYTIREAHSPGMVQTFPSPTGAGNGAYLNRVVVSNQIIRDLNFGNMAARDFGDAPSSYPVASHGILVGFGLGTNVDAEAASPASPGLGANVDDNTPTAGPDDEDGLVTTPLLAPGKNDATLQVRLRTGSFSSGVLQGWIDFNGDGDWNDSGEQVIKDRVTSATNSGGTAITVSVPGNAVIGSTYLRLRYGYERGIGPGGSAQAGEVEDHLVTILGDQPVANPDFFPRSGEPLIKQGSVDNVLDVLDNDFGVFDAQGNQQPVMIFLGDFPSFDSLGRPSRTLPSGTIVSVDVVNQVLLYSPGPNVFGNETFQYRVTSGGQTSAPTTVTVNVTASDPIAIDDIVRVPPFLVPLPLPTPLPPVPINTIDVLANDIKLPGTKIKAGSVVKITQGVTGDVMTTNANSDMLLFSPPVNFQGTIIYEYTIEDSDPNTLDSTARVTVQVTPSDTTPAPAHLAQFSVQYLDANLNPLAGPNPMVSVDDEFFYVRVIADDIQGDTPETEGVEAAYVDLILESLNSSMPLAEPVILPGTPAAYDITFDGNLYGTAQRVQVNDATPGTVGEVGGTHDPRTPPGSPANPLPVGVGPKTVMTIKFRILGAGKVRVQPDHAEAQVTGIVVYDQQAAAGNNAISITDEQVFMRPADTLMITGAGEGEFANRNNSLDVNADGGVNALDVLIVINDLNANGPRNLNQLNIATSGIIPGNFFLDANVDSHVNAIDTLVIINYLNSSLASTPATAPLPEGEGEFSLPAGVPSDGEIGEGEAAMLAGLSSLPAASNDNLDQVAAFMAGEGELPVCPVVETTSEANAESSRQLKKRRISRESNGGGAAESSSAAQKAIRRAKAEAAATDTSSLDELFARLANQRDEQRGRRSGRR